MFVSNLDWNFDSGALLYSGGLLPSKKVKMKSPTTSVSRSVLIPTDRKSVWLKAGHPGLLSAQVPMLRSFHAPSPLAVGAPVSECHTILGVAEEYVGEITSYEENVRWGMTSAPAKSGGLLALPHDVEYVFSDEDAACRLTVQCAYKPQGLLSLPGVRWLVGWFMGKTIEMLLNTALRRATAVA